MMRDRSPKKLVRLLSDSRLREYSSMLQHALEQGYSVGGVADFALGLLQPPCIVLRHDVDVPRRGVRELFNIERSLDIRSTWYFRWSTVWPELMQEMIAYGNEVGLHYQSLADICMEHGIDDFRKLHANHIDEARERLASELVRFRREYGVPCRTIASHGHPLNSKLTVANNQIMDSGFKSRMNLAAEAYDEDIVSRFDAYVSDAWPLLNNGWTYGRSFIDVVSDEPNVACLLIHPQHWKHDLSSSIKLILNWIVRGPQFIKITFKTKYDDVIIYDGGS